MSVNRRTSFADVDILPRAAPARAPEGLGSTGDPSFNSIWTLAWTHADLARREGPNGLPLGIQLVGPRFHDEALLDAAAWVESKALLERQSTKSSSPGLSGDPRGWPGQPGHDA